jgi:hypothetical protein
VESPAKFDLLMKGKGCNPHRPVAIHVIRIPLVSSLSKKAQQTLDPLVKVRRPTPTTLNPYHKPRNPKNPSF